MTAHAPFSYPFVATQRLQTTRSLHAHTLSYCLGAAPVSGCLNWLLLVAKAVAPPAPKPGTDSAPLWAAVKAAREMPVEALATPLAPAPCCGPRNCGRMLGGGSGDVMRVRSGEPSVRRLERGASFLARETSSLTPFCRVSSDADVAAVVAVADADVATVTAAVAVVVEAPGARRPRVLGGTAQRGAWPAWGMVAPAVVEEGGVGCHWMCEWAARMCV